MKLKAKLTAAIIAVAAIATPALHAQQDLILVDYAAIADAVAANPDNYRALTTRFEQSDTTLTLPELATVYYGFAFTPEYNPDAEYPEIGEALDKNDVSLAIALCDEVLRKNPVSLPTLFTLFGCCAISENPTINARKESVRARILMLCDLINASGLGVQPTAPFCVISEADMDEWLTKYVRIQSEIDRTDLAAEKAVKVRIEGVPDDVILYFDLVVPKTWRATQLPTEQTEN